MSSSSRLAGRAGKMAAAGAPDGLIGSGVIFVVVGVYLLFGVGVTLVVLGATMVAVGWLVS